jgi:hypothetical protein
LGNGRAAGTLVLLLSAAAAAAPSARAAEDDAAIRADLASFVDLARWVREDYDGPSPTALARRILARKEKDVRPLLKEAWLLAVARDSRWEIELPLERAVRYLYGLEVAAAPKPEAGKISFGDTVGAVFEKEGLVLVRTGGDGSRGKVMGEPGWDNNDPPPKKAFEALVKGGKWRASPRTDIRKALALLDDGTVAKWTDDERRSFAMGLGEALGADAGALPKLLERFEGDPNDAILGRAVAWAGVPRSVAFLAEKIGPLSKRVASGRQAALPLLQTACRGVGRTDPAALAAELAKLQGPDRDAALLGAGFRVASRVLTDEYEKGADDAGRNAAVLAMARLTFQASFSRELPGPAEMPRVLRALVAGCGAADEETRRVADQCGYGLFYMGWRDGKAGIHHSSNGVAVDGDGERLGPYPDMPTLLRRMDEDVAQGRLAFSDDDLGLFDRSLPAVVETYQRAWTGIPCPEPNTMDAGKDAPLRMKAEPVEGGIRLTLTNAGTPPVALNPLVLRYPCADYIPVTVTGQGAPKSFTELKLDFGPPGGWERWTVDAKQLVTLKSGESHTWDVALREAHRGADHIEVSVSDRMRITGGSVVPVLRRYSAWVR